MDMDRNQNQSEKKADCRTAEYLEWKYGTDIQRGLTLAGVRQRQRGYTYYKAKEKKRIWLTCLKQECQNPLFFFFLYLCVVSVLFPFTQRMKVTMFVSFTVYFFLKMKKTLRYSKALFRQKEISGSKAIVLRDNTFQCVPTEQLVQGDIVRLKRKKKVPLAVISLKPPYKEYKQGEVFMENTGRAIIVQQEANAFHSLKNAKSGRYAKKYETTESKRRSKELANTYVAEEKVPEEFTRNDIEKVFFQELFIHQEIYFQPDFFKKTFTEKKEPIIAVGFEETYFPSEFQKEKFQQFMQALKNTGVEWFFFTSQDRERAFSVGKRAGIVEGKREVIDKKQFLLLKNIALEKQIKSIRIYCELSRSEKEQVIAMWEKYGQADSKNSVKGKGRLLFMSGLKRTNQEKTAENCVYACCNSGNQDRDICFGRYWRDAMIQYLIGENRCQKFFRQVKQWETQILVSLCIFVFLLLLLELYMPGQGNMQWVVQMGSLFAVIYIIGREIVQEGFRKWFLRKLNTDGLRR